MQYNNPIREPLYKVEDKVMGFHTHYPVSGIIKHINWNVVNLEWEYSVENSDGFEGKIKEGKILRFDKDIWSLVEKKWKRYLELMKEAAGIESDCRNLLNAKKGSESNGR